MLACYGTLAQLPTFSVVFAKAWCEQLSFALTSFGPSERQKNPASFQLPCHLGRWEFSSSSLNIFPSLICIHFTMLLGYN